MSPLFNSLGFGPASVVIKDGVPLSTHARARVQVGQIKLVRMGHVVSTDTPTLKFMDVCDEVFSEAPRVKEVGK